MIEKRYDPDSFEERCLSYWQKNKKFKFKDSKELEPFCIMMPPPNITGSLHIGHALTFSLQDILVRFQKKLGKAVLWQAGTDHAGIATEIIVEKKLLLEKLEKKKIGRKKFIKEVWKWKEQSGSKIINQLKRMGTAVDWERSRFTMDSGLSAAVNHVFIDLYKNGLIYKDKRLVNWDPELQTAVSDLEVNQKEVKGKLWYIKYKIVGSNENIVIATTRPETMFGDAGIAVHPQNESLKKYIGMKAVIPFLKKEIPIIGDNYADPDKGSGAVKITPGHDFNDFIVGKRHNLEIINILNKSGTLNQFSPEKYQGLDRFVARKKILNELKENIQKVEENLMVIPVGDRTGSVIEPLLTDQWFCDAKKLSDPIKKFVKNSKLNFHPQSWVNSFNNWIDNIEPWCISRQIWWGHRIPAWYSDCGEIFVAKNEKEAHELAKKKFGNNPFKLNQDDDVLDTWFSSALWPFSSLGWPEKKEEVERFYPTDVLITGFDIIFFWVARMVMMGIKFLDDIPFKDVYIHPLVKDEKGQKMSKSKGNVIDPLELINIYGSDALRFTLVSLSTQGRDIKLSNKLVENNRNFITKIWNAARFYDLNGFKLNERFDPQESKLVVNSWIIYQFTQTQKKVLKHIECYQFNHATDKLYHFIWNDFCDLYLELVKPYLNKDDLKLEISSTFAWVFKNILNLSNPFLPFITEEISYRLEFTEEFSLFENKFSDISKLKVNKDKIKSFERLIIFIKDCREFIKNKNISNMSDLYTFSNLDAEFVENNKIIISSILKIKNFKKNKDIDESKINIFISSGRKFGFFVKKDDSKKELITKRSFYIDEINFLSKNLNNKNFVENAPKKIVDKQKEKLDSAKNNLSLIEELIKNNV